MNRVKRGKDFKVLWSFFDFEGKPYLLDKTFLTLYVSNSFDRFEVTDFVVEENTLIWFFRGKDQKALGDYTLELIKNNGTEGMIPIDSVDAFTLVQYSRDESLCGGGNVKIEDVTVNSTLDIETIASLVIDTEFSETSPNALANNVITKEFKRVNEAIENIDIDADSELSDTSENPVQNKVVARALTQIQETLDNKQEQLVSGENIKTINGESILGEGDIEIKGGSSTYVTDFTVADLNEAINGSPKQCNLARLKQALENKEIVLVPFGPEELAGYSLLQGYSEDLLYFAMTDERGNIYSVETDTNAREIYSENVTFISPVTNQADIESLKNDKVSKDDVATINGQSLTNGGNIVIEGKNYDAVIEQQQTKLTELSEEVNDVAEKIGNINPTPMVSVTYAELVALRDNGELVAGMQYRITDFVTTTAQENTRSAGHQFDIIVTADNENTLNEVARACLHEGDTYFSEAGANLAAWEIWYSLDNDSERFAWADTENGKGVIYRMIDEWNNDCPYDFKNIQFKRYILEADDAFATDVAKGGELEIVNEKLQEMSHKIHTNVWYYGGYISDVYPDANPEIRYVPFGDVDYNIAGPQVLCEIDENNYGWFYTFHNEGEDASLLKFNVDENVGVYDNTIKDSCYIFLVEEGTGSYYPTKINAQSLNNIVFVGNGCYSNSFGNNCNSNSFGNNCYYNTFGNGCNSNSFGNGCNYNSFGNGCYSNSFGNNCYYNSFGNNCYSNTFGNDCNYNSFGNNCYSNSFKDMDGIADNASYNRVDDGVHDVGLYYDDNNGNYGGLNNHHICRGCSNRQIEIYQNRDYETTYTMTSDGELREFVLGDVV